MCVFDSICVCMFVLCVYAHMNVSVFMYVCMCTQV